MNLVATIITSEIKPLNKNVVSELLNSFSSITEVKTIKECISFDIYFNSAEYEIDNGAQIGERFGMDVIIQEASKRKKKLLICDMESTIIDNEFLDELADSLDIKPQVAAITVAAMNGEIDFAAALKERVALLKSISEADISNIIETRLKYNPGAKELITACKRAGVYTMLVSGGFTMFTEHVAKEIGFDESHANQLIFKGGKISGVAEPVLDKDAKLRILKAKALELKIKLDQTAALGDGANDLPMLQSAGLGIAYMAKAKVKEQIKNQINYSSLEAVAYALGLSLSGN